MIPVVIQDKISIKSQAGCLRRNRE